MAHVRQLIDHTNTGCPSKMILKENTAGRSTRIQLYITAGTTLTITKRFFTTTATMTRPLRSFSNRSLLLFVLASVARAQLQPSSETAFWGFRSEYAKAVDIDSATRSTRSALYNEFSGEAQLSDASKRVLLDYGPSHDPSEWLPMTDTTSAAIGTVLGGRTYLSSNKTTLYSDIAIRVAQSLGNKTQQPLVPGSVIHALRP